jgi:site-specific recombinase XerD
VRKGFVDIELFDRIHAAISDLYRDMAEFLFLSGWRYEEVCGLELAWVFLADAEIRLPDSKNGQGRVIVLEAGSSSWWRSGGPGAGWTARISSTETGAA